MTGTTASTASTAGTAATEPTLDADRAAAYLRRLGEPPGAVPDNGLPAGGAPLDGGALARLHRAHLLAVPFENLAVHLGEPIVLDVPALVTKLVDRHRGGFCYELNGAFAALLRTLGADVRHVAARVHTGDGAFSPPFDHLALVVRTPAGDGPWLVDVGFGDHSVHPLRLDDRGEQHDAGGVFRLVDVEDGDVEVRRDGAPQYRVELRPRRLTDFGPTSWYQQTSPASHFTRSLVCSRLTDDGRVTLSGSRLVTTVAGARSERVLESDGAVLAAYRDLFGITLDRVPRVREAPTTP